MCECVGVGVGVDREASGFPGGTDAIATRLLGACVYVCMCVDVCGWGGTWPSTEALMT